MILNHTQLERLFELWRLRLPIQQDLVLIAIRGALPKGRSKGFVQEKELVKVKVDYKHYRCSIGIWDRKNQQVYFAPGSTVPHWDQVEKSILKKGKGSNQLECGYYTDFEKGEHLQGKLRGHQALRQTANRLIRRTETGVPIGLKDQLYFSNPYDNLHCGWNEEPKKAGYSSAGCLVVAGLPRCYRLDKDSENKGDWKVFKGLLYQHPQNLFALGLWDYPSVKASLGKAKRRGLMYGSEGAEVVALQGELKKKGLYKGGLSGVLDGKTYKAWNKVGLKLNLE